MKKSELDVLTEMNDNIYEIKKMIKMWYLITVAAIAFAVAAAVANFLMSL